MIFLIQASSRTWYGDEEFCVRTLDGHPAIYWTIKHIIENFDNAEVIIVAPAYDKNGKLNALKSNFPHLKLHYSHNDSPLRRMVAALADTPDNTFCCRLNALNFGFDVSLIKEMVTLAQRENLECVKSADDYPPHLTGEIYQAGALRKLIRKIDKGEIDQPERHEIHPRFILMKLDEFKTAYCRSNTFLPEKEMILYTEKMRQVMTEERSPVTERLSVPQGDQLSFHYKLAIDYLQSNVPPGSKILDIACGPGYGTMQLAGNGYLAIGGDYDSDVIAENIAKYRENCELSFEQQNAMALSFDDHSFDAVLSMETIEHVIDPEKMLQELARVLKPGGTIIMSTPQSSYPGKCVNPVHIYEFSLDEFKNMFTRHFDIQKLIGLKGGTIFFEDDPIGTNTMVFARTRA
ncbi:MAG: class I SAM-dependent methyltransferase [Deltaproteobacteria bacterium]|nr:class I SAM-dependent methyltransferase [Deltaproteobacteria bacterium]